MKKNYFLLGIGTGLVVIVVVFLVYQVVAKTKKNPHVSNYTAQIDEGYGISDSSPILKTKCTPNARLVIDKFRPDKLYSCTEEMVKFGNKKIPYIQINYNVEGLPSISAQRIYAIVIDGQPILIPALPQYYMVGSYEYGGEVEINNRYNCDIDYYTGDSDNKITYEVVWYKNAYHWKVNYDHVIGKKYYDKVCTVTGYEIKGASYAEKSFFNLMVK